MDDKVDLVEKLGLFDEHFSPKVVGTVNTGDAGGALTAEDERS